MFGHFDAAWIALKILCKRRSNFFFLLFFSRVSSRLLFYPVAPVVETYRCCVGRHDLAPVGVSAQEEAQNVGRVRNTLDRQPVGTNDAGEGVEDERPDRGRVADLRKSKIGCQRESGQKVTAGEKKKG